MKIEDRKAGVDESIFNSPSSITILYHPSSTVFALVYNTLMRLIRLFNSYRQITYALAGVAFVVIGTFIALKWARGYRPSFIGGKPPAISGTGLLVANSDPKGAEVIVNGKLTTATDDTLNLTPGTYDIEIRKNGFADWKKKLQIQAELVTQTTAKLFPSVPNLTPITYTGVKNITPSPDGQKIAYIVSDATNSANNGLWVIELLSRNLPISRASEPKQILKNISKYDLSTSIMIWSPDSGQILVYWVEETETVKVSNKARPSAGRPGLSKKQETGSLISTAILLAADKLNDEAGVRDASSRLPVLLAQWIQSLDIKDAEKLGKLADPIKELMVSGADVVYFSPDELKILYAPIADASIPTGIIPDLPSESTQPETRDIKRNSIYIYDIKEDRNYEINQAVLNAPLRLPKPNDEGKGLDGWDEKDGNIYWNERISTWFLPQTLEKFDLPPVPERLLTKALMFLKSKYSPIWDESVQWFPSSNHLIMVKDGKIFIEEYDNTNSVAVYSGPFSENFTYPWPNGDKLVILSSLNSDSPANLYAINLK